VSDKEKSVTQIMKWRCCLQVTKEVNWMPPSSFTHTHPYTPLGLWASTVSLM